MQFPFRNVRDVLGLHAKVSSRKVALISYDRQHQRRDLSYLELVGKAHQVANFLYEDLQIQRGDTIAIISPNTENALILYAATWVIGAAITALDADATADTIAHQLTDSGASVLFADHTLLASAQSAMADSPHVQGIIQIGGAQHADYLRFEELAANRPTTFLGDESGAKGADVPMTGGNDRTARLTDRALITYHDGIACARTQGTLLMNAMYLANATALTGNQVTLAVLPLHQAFSEAILAPLMVGATVILTETATPDQFWQYLVQHRAHTAVLDAVYLQAMVTNAREHIANGKMRFGGKIIQQDTKHFRHIITTDPTLTSTLACDFETVFGLPLITGFKHPQSDQLLTLLPITLAWTHHQAILHGTETASIGAALHPLTIVDAEGHVVEARTMGELAIMQPDGTAIPIGVRGSYTSDDNAQQYFYLA